MHPLALVSSPVYRKHSLPQHPEHPKRLEAIEARLRDAGIWEEALVLEPRRVTREELLLVHTNSYIEQIEGIAGKKGLFDFETYYNEHSYEAAILSAGGLLTAVEAMLEGKTRRAMALGRPPGHHCTGRKPMGFCLFNNIAIAARALIQQHQLERVAIVDFDVHHGNGTQEIFYDDPQVFFLSLHEYPLWPMSGVKEECGTGSATGTTLNVPLPGGTGPAEYLEAFRDALDSLFEFRPEFLLISAGFDAHRLDPLATMALESDTFGQLTKELVERAEAAGVQGIVSTLEGGYHFEALAESVEAHLRALW